MELFSKMLDVMRNDVIEGKLNYMDHFLIDVLLAEYVKLGLYHRYVDSGRIEALPYSLGEIGSLVKKNRTTIDDSIVRLVQNEYLTVRKGDRRGERSVFSPTPKMLGPATVKNSELCVMSSCACEWSVIQAELKKQRIDAYLPNFKQYQQQHPLSTNDVLSIVRSFAKKIDAVKAQKQSFGKTGANGYLYQSFRRKLLEISPSQLPLTAQSAGSKVSPHQNVDPSILQLRELASKLNDGSVIDPNLIPVAQYTTWINDGILKFEGSTCFASPDYIFFLKEDLRRIQSMPKSVYYRSIDANKRGNVRSLSDSISSLIGENSHASDIVPKPAHTV